MANSWCNSKNILFYFCLVCALFFISGCELSIVSEEKIMVNASESINDTIGEIIKNNISGKCDPGWKCISTKHRAYLAENCSWIDKKECSTACVNGTCRVPEKCVSGFLCVGNDRLAYQMENCQRAKEKFCECGCVNNSCVSNCSVTVNGNVSNGTVKKSSAIDDTEKEKAVTIVTTSYLNLGEKISINVNSIEHNISIYNLEVDRVMINLDNFRSGWISEKGNFTYNNNNNNNVTIFVREILFQSYADGKKMIGYVLK